MVARAAGAVVAANVVMTVVVTLPVILRTLVNIYRIKRTSTVWLSQREQHYVTAPTAD